MSDFFSVDRDVAGFGGTLVRATDEALLEHDVRYWSGPRSLRLWLPKAGAGFAQRDGSAHLAAGGTLRSLRETLERTLDDEIEGGVGRARRTGLAPTEEASVLAALR
ncbi:MAG: hypothetical protein ACK4MD_02925 [Demequina sp.]